MNEKYYIGLDVGGTKTAISLGKIEQDRVSILLREEVKTTTDPIKTLEPLLSLANSWKKEYEVSGLGISCGGPLDATKGKLLNPPHLLGWHNFNIVKHVRNVCDLPTKLQNDANAGAVAEWKYGAGKGYKNVIFLTFGTGLGAGLILNNQLYSGTNDNAGEVGHIRIANKGPKSYGKSGSLEGFASGSGITKLAKEMAKKEKDVPPYVFDEDLNTKLLAQKAKEGDAFALKVFKKSGTMLGKGLSILIDILNPEVIIMGGVFMRVGELLIPSMEKEIKKEALKYSRKVALIKPAELKENIGDIAAISIISE